MSTGPGARSLFSLLDSHQPTRRHPSTWQMASWEAIAESRWHEATGLDALADASRRVAGFLGRHSSPGNRALIALPPGPDFLAAFFGCVAAGIIAVPVPEWRGARGRARVDEIARECDPSLLIIDEPPAVGDVPALRIVTPDELSRHGERFDGPPCGGDTPAYLQFTSGSTGAPRGVVITHDNVFANLHAIDGWVDVSSDWYVSWLPFYHDMGLVKAIYCLYSGMCLAYESPQRFVQRPWRWVQTISRVRACSSGGPNFAYELLNRTAPADDTPLDLSCWTTAFCGAEPIRPNTLRRFASRFSASGFSPNALSPGYGLAEFTLVVSAALPRRAPEFRAPEFRASERSGGAERSALHEISECGEALRGVTIRIVNPDTLRALSDGTVGEIWLAGASKAQGYWGRRDESTPVFEAVIDGEPDHQYLRTGDLGFLDGGRLFVVGRAKELVIVRGRNFHPHEIERAVQAAHPALEGTAAAFSIESAEGEGLGVVCEVRRTFVRDLPTRAIIHAIQRELVRRFEVGAVQITLVRPGGVPRTTSGKVQRLRCRDQLRSGDLRALAEWTAPVDTTPLVVDDGVTPGSPDRVAIANWIADWVEAWLGLDGDAIDPRVPLASFGLDSLRAVQLIYALEDWLDVTLDETLTWRESTIDGLSRWLERLLIGAHENGETESARPPSAAEGILARIESLEESEVQRLFAVRVLKGSPCKSS